MTTQSYLYRESSDRLSQLFLENKKKNRNIIVVDGLKHVGKALEVKELLKNTSYLWINLSKEKSLLKDIDSSQSFLDFQDVLNIRKGFVPQTGQTLVINKAHYSNKLATFIKDIKNNWHHQNVILITSNINRLFRNGIENHLSHITRHSIHPLSYTEFLKAINENYLHDRLMDWNIKTPFSDPLHHKALDLLETYLNIGGIPKIVSSFLQGQDWHDVITEIIFDYVAEYKSIYGEEKADLFETIIQKTATNLGGISKLTNILSLSHNNYSDLPSILSYLEGLGVIYKTPIRSPSENNARKCIIKTSKIPPKRYICDHGIRDHFTTSAPQIFQTLATTPRLIQEQAQGLLENHVLCELKSRGLKNAISWRQKVNGSQVSFIIKSGSGHSFIPIDVKASLKTNKKYFTSLLNCMNDLELDHGVLFSADKGNISDYNGKQILQVPVYCVFKL